MLAQREMYCKGNQIIDINMLFVRDKIVSFHVPGRTHRHVVIKPQEIFFNSDLQVDHLREAIEGRNSLNIIDILGIFKRGNMRAEIFTNCLPLPLARIKVRDGQT